MFKPTFLIFIIVSVISCNNPKPQPKAMVVVHGGAGYVSTDLMLTWRRRGDSGSNQKITTKKSSAFGKWRHQR